MVSISRYTPDNLPSPLTPGDEPLKKEIDLFGFGLKERKGSFRTFDPTQSRFAVAMTSGACVRL